jgi:hypothetical protein
MARKKRKYVVLPAPEKLLKKAATTRLTMWNSHDPTSKEGRVGHIEQS